MARIDYIHISNSNSDTEHVSAGRECWVLYALHSLWNDLKYYLWVRAAGCQKMLCCEYEGVKKQTKNKGSMWHVLYRRMCFLMRHMAAPAGALILLLW